ncbi:MAG: PLP-dependent aminotransferase family protein [Candidatus Bipolaricaulota bacterium]
MLRLVSTNEVIGMGIAVDRPQPGSGPYHVQLATSLRTRLERGELRSGDQLPTSRELAKELGVSRSTVVRAYEELERGGWVEGRVGRGTVVTARGAAEGRAGPDWDGLLTDRARPSSTEHGEVLRMLATPGLLSFAGGVPSPEFYPAEAFQQITSEVLRQQGPRILQSCPLDGYPPLRSWIAERAGCAAEEVIVLTGSTQGLHLLAQAFVRPGDAVIVEAPTYAGALRAFRAAGARIHGIPSGPLGLDLDALRALLRRVQPKLLYVIPTHHNPTGASLSIPRREALLDMAAEYGLPVVEDDAYATLRYDGPALPSLRSLDRGGHVIYLSTFSKALFPGLRVGWMMAPQPVVRRLSSLRNVIDLFTNSLTQATLYEFCKRGLLDAHLQQVRPIYAERRDSMASALRRYAPELSFDVPHGGLFLWVRLSEKVTGFRLLQASVQQGLGFLVGTLFHAGSGGENHIRLCFATHPQRAISDGARKLAVALRQVGEEDVVRREVDAEGFVV